MRVTRLRFGGAGGRGRARRGGGFARGFTVVEFLIGLAITAVTSTAILAMLTAAAKTSSLVTAEATAQWELDATMRRVTQQVRMSQKGSLALSADTNGNPTFTLVTQPDVTATVYSVSYALALAPDGTKNFIETDPRYGTSVLVHNVQAYSAQLKNPAAPVILLVTLIAGKNDAQTARTFEAAPRNQ